MPMDELVENAPTARPRTGPPSQTESATTIALVRIPGAEEMDDDNPFLAIYYNEDGSIAYRERIRESTASWMKKHRSAVEMSEEQLSHIRGKKMSPKQAAMGYTDPDLINSQPLTEEDIESGIRTTELELPPPRRVGKPDTPHWPTGGP